MIVGGGAAGLETARIASLRGHSVSLYEKDKSIGGQLNIASLAPGRVDFAEVPRYYDYHMQLLNVGIHLETLVTPEMVFEQNPDVVVIATGSKPWLPEVPGMETAHIVDVRELLRNQSIIKGEKALVVAYEHHAKGLSAAEFLADRGIHVELITDALYAGGQLDRPTHEAAYIRLIKKSVIITPLTRLKKIQGTSVVVENTLSYIERVIDNVDNIVISTDGKADDDLYRNLKGRVKDIYLVGQCLSPRMLIDSVKDGSRIGRII
jgi:NADPH-dependent 2,4-dienoyl-CoA reductase/sulfur reductase-like enzyme